MKHETHRTRRLVLLCITLLLSGACVAAERLHLIIPAGPGGGLDATARALGNALVATDIAANVSYENRSGGGGGKAMAYFVSSGDTLKNTLLVNSAPLIVRSLQGLFPHSYRDLTPIAGLIADPGVIAVREDSEFQSWRDVAAELKSGKKRVFVADPSRAAWITSPCHCWPRPKALIHAGFGTWPMTAVPKPSWLC
jgi:putative tricarboxylic transport membrane protein